MLYIYYGEDINTARAKVQATISNMLAKSPDAMYFRITPETLNEYNFEEIIYSQSLFKNEYIVLLDTLFSSKEGENIVLNNLEQIAKAPHPFFLLDKKLLAPTRKKLEKFATKIQKYDKENTIKNNNNSFEFTDAIGERNIKKAWSLFIQSKNNGDSDEEIHGRIFWIVKSIIIAGKVKTAEDAGMKPYSYKKAKQFFKNFKSIDNVEEVLMRLSLLPQKARRSSIPLEIELEKFILTL